MNFCVFFSCEYHYDSECTLYHLLNKPLSLSLSLSPIDSIQAEAELSFSVCRIDEYTYQEAVPIIKTLRT